jgi:hypothetical protein
LCPCGTQDGWARAEIRLQQTDRLGVIGLSGNPTIVRRRNRLPRCARHGGTPVHRSFKAGRGYRHCGAGQQHGTDSPSWFPFRSLRQCVHSLDRDVGHVLPKPLRSTTSCAHRALHVTSDETRVSRSVLRVQLVRSDPLGRAGPGRRFVCIRPLLPSKRVKGSARTCSMAPSRQVNRLETVNAKASGDQRRSDTSVAGRVVV